MELANPGLFGQHGGLLGTTVETAAEVEEARLWILVSPEFLAQVVKCYRCILVSSYPELLRSERQSVIQDFVR